MYNTKLIDLYIQTWYKGIHSEPWASKLGRYNERGIMPVAPFFPYKNKKRRKVVLAFIEELGVGFLFGNVLYFSKKKCIIGRVQLYIFPADLWDFYMEEHCEYGLYGSHEPCPYGLNMPENYEYGDFLGVRRKPKPKEWFPDVDEFLKQWRFCFFYYFFPIIYFMAIRDGQIHVWSLQFDDFEWLYKLSGDRIYSKAELYSLVDLFIENCIFDDDFCFFLELDCSNILFKDLDLSIYDLNGYN